MFAKMISDTQVTEINKPIQLRHPALPRNAKPCKIDWFENFIRPKLESIGMVLFHCTLSIVILSID